MDISAPTGPEPVEENRVTTGDAAAPRPAPKRAATCRSAIAVGVLLGAAVLVSLLTVRHIFVGIVAVAVAMGTYELAGALKRGADIRVTLWPVLIGGQAMVWLSWPFGRDGLLAAFVLTILACLVWRLRDGADGYLRDVGASILAAAYVPLFASFAAMLVVAEDGVARVLCFLIVVVCHDVGGYTTGAMLGRHPMAPLDQSEEVLGGLRGFHARRHHRAARSR